MTLFDYLFEQWANEWENRQIQEAYAIQLARYVVREAAQAEISELERQWNMPHG